MKKIVDGIEINLSDAEIAEKQARDTAWAEGANDRLAATHRDTRNALLAASDWTQSNDSPLAAAKKVEWASYRTSLRTLPTHENWPSLEDADWPTIPS